MPIEPLKWNPICVWVWITNEYGKFLSYNLPEMNVAMEGLQYQPIISDALRSNKYEVFIDCGSYIGYFSVIGAKHCKKVVAFEASPFFYGLTLFNTKYLWNVDCRYKWVSNKGEHPNSCDSLDMVSIQSNHPHNIEVVALDDELYELIKDKKTLIKMDIEGSELLALKGSSKLLQLPNVHWMIDIHWQCGVMNEDIIPFFKNRTFRTDDKWIEVY